MDPTHSEPQVPEQQWLEPPIPTKNDKFLEQRIEELEQQVAAYDALLNELPDLFERKVPRTPGTHFGAIPAALGTTKDEHTRG
jgi:hypothetical protein